MNGHDGSGKWFDEVAVGEHFSRSVTVTETHLVLGAGLIGPAVMSLVVLGCGALTWVAHSGLRPMLVP